MRRAKNPIQNEMPEKSADITRGKRAEQTLEEAKERAENYLNIAGVMLATVDADETISMMNQKGRELLGYEHKELVGRNWFDLLVPEGTRGEVRRVFGMLMANEIKSVEYYENPLVKKNGEERLFSFHNTVVRDKTGNIVSVLFSAEDITERKRTEEELRRSHDFLNSIINGIHEKLMIVNRDGVILDVNKSVLERHELTKEKIVGRHCYEVMYGTDAPCPHEERICPTRLVFDTGVPVRTEHTCLSRDGNELVIEAYAFPLFDETGNVKFVAQIQEDITERVHAEEIKKHTEKLVATGRMAARVAHEINNPLAGIKNSFLLIKDAVTEDHPYYAYVGRIENEIERIARIVRNMYDLYSPEQEKAVEFVLGEAIEDVTTLLEPRCREREVTLKVKMLRKPIVVNLPKGSLFQVLFNVIQNALAASPKGAEVSVGASVKADRVTISVSDHGPGVPEELHGRIFEPFFTTKCNHEGAGLGLGLSISRSLVQAMGGTIDFETKPGERTVFNIRLPKSERKGGQ